MTRYTPKANKAYFGWETNIRTINATKDAAPIVTDIDFILNADTISLTEWKPTMERSQPWYVNNPTRLPSYTYESAYKPASGKISGPLKHGRGIAAILGTTSIVDHTTYDSVTLDGTGAKRKPFFGYFEHGADRVKAILGCSAESISLECKEGEQVSQNLDATTAKEVDLAQLTTPTYASNMEMLSVPNFHWKHVSIGLYNGKWSSGSIEALLPSIKNNIADQAEWESFKFSIKNNITYKFGAPPSAGDLNARWFFDALMEIELDLDVYPATVDEIIWELSPQYAKYADYATLLSNDVVSAELKFTRDTNDFIQIRIEDLVFMSTSEELASITSGVDPAKMVLKPASKNSLLTVYIEDPLQNSKSPYPPV
jgi:hypothetical protein